MPSPPPAFHLTREIAVYIFERRWVLHDAQEGTGYLNLAFLSSDSMLLQVGAVPAVGKVSGFLAELITLGGAALRQAGKSHSVRAVVLSRETAISR